MGAALIRKCWNVQEERWQTNDMRDTESTDYVSYIELFFYSQSNQTRNKQRQSI